MAEDHVAYTIEVNQHSYSANELERGRFEVSHINYDSTPISPPETGFVVFDPKTNTYSFQGNTNIDQNDQQPIVEKIIMLHS